jgi:hypothetical protein
MDENERQASNLSNLVDLWRKGYITSEELMKAVHLDLLRVVTQRAVEK